MVVYTGAIKPQAYALVFPLNKKNNKHFKILIMQSKNKFWSAEKMQVADRCEDKNCRLYYDEGQQMYFVIAKYVDGSILHTKETELFKSRKISEVNTFITSSNPF